MSKPILQIWDETSQAYVPVSVIKGPKGDPGADGKDGTNGKDGKDGATGPAYTLTDADKAAIVTAVIAALPDGSEVSY